MSDSSFQRRKADRPDELVDAAFHEFAERGYAETRLQDVAKRAGVSKGLPYLYFKTKEELFKAVLKGIVKPFLDRLFAGVEQSDLTVEEFLRGPFLTFARGFVRSRRARVLRLLIAEGPKHPDLTAFYASHVLAPAIDAMRAVLRRGLERGEFSNPDIVRFPQLIVAPVMLGAIWHQLFSQHVELDLDAMLGVHVDNILRALDVGGRS